MAPARRFTHALGCAALIAAFMMATSVAKAQGQDRRQDQPGYTVDVTRIYNFVSVRDQSGKFVAGLTKDDFIVRVNGEMVEVEAIDEVRNLKRSSRAWRRMAESGDPRGAVGPDNTYIAPKHIVLVFDVFNSGPFSIRSAKETANRLLDELLPIDYVSVFEYNGTLRQLTRAEVTGPEEARAAIDKVIRSGRNPYYSSSPGSEIERETLRTLYRDYLRSMYELANGLAHQSVIHRFILFSEGVNLSDSEINRSQDIGEILSFNDALPEDISRARGDAIGEVRGAMTSSLDNNISDFQHFMSGADAVFYTVRRGLMIPEYEMTGADQDISAGGSKFGRNDGIGDNRTVAGLAQNDVRSREDELREFANLTGGRYFSAGMNDERFVDELLEEVGNYYQLFFTVPSNLDREGYNTLEVSVKGEAYEVAHRRGFFGPAIREQLAQREKAFAPTGERIVAPTQAQLKTFVVQQRSGAEALCYVEIPARELIAEDGESRLEFRLKSQGGGEAGEEVSHRLSAKIPEEPGGVLNFYSSVKLPSNNNSLMLTLNDPASGREISFESSIGLHESGNSNLLLSQPILLAPAQTPTVALSDSDDERRGKDRAGALLAGVSGRPLTTPEVAVSQMVEIVLFIGRKDTAWTEEHMPVNIQFVIDKPDGSQAVLRVADGGFDFPVDAELLRYRALVPLGYAPAGENGLIVMVSARGGEETASTLIHFTVK